MIIGSAVDTGLQKITGLLTPEIKKLCRYTA